MSRICYMLDDDAHRVFKLACVKAGETMNAANCKMAALYASGLLCALAEDAATDSKATAPRMMACAVAIAEWLKRWEGRDGCSG